MNTKMKKLIFHATIFAGNRKFVRPQDVSSARKTGKLYGFEFVQDKKKKKKAVEEDATDVATDVAADVTPVAVE